VQVEHCVTEMVTGIDIVKEGIRAAAGEQLSITQDDVQLKGHAIECRINAEDASKNFAPAPGRIGAYKEPGGPGVRVDTFVEDGATVPPYYDSLIAKVIVRDETRDAAITRARRALRELDVRGVPTTRDAALDILGSDEFRSGEYSTSFLEEAGARLPALVAT